MILPPIHFDCLFERLRAIHAPCSPSRFCVLITFLTFPIFAADIDVTVRDATSGQTELVVLPGTELTFEVTAELTAGDTQGLALIVLDLACDAGIFGATQVPSQMPMLQFTPPLGFSQNPQGYGGTAHGVWLEQVGGAQNVFSHGAWACTENGECPAPSTCNGTQCTPLSGLPTGTLLTGIAQPGQSVVVISGTWTAPQEDGVYAIRVDRLSATAVRSGTTGDPYWKTEAAPPGDVTDLTVTVRAVTAEIPTLSNLGLLGLACTLAILALIAGRALRKPSQNVG